MNGITLPPKFKCENCGRWAHFKGDAFRCFWCYAEMIERDFNGIVPEGVRDE